MSRSFLSFKILNLYKQTGAEMQCSLNCYNCGFLAVAKSSRNDNSLCDWRFLSSSNIINDVHCLQKLNDAKTPIEN